MKNIPNYVWWIVGVLVILIIIGYFAGWFASSSTNSATPSKRVLAGVIRVNKGTKQGIPSNYKLCCTKGQYDIYCQDCMSDSCKNVC